MKTNEEIAGELWRCIKADFEKKGLSLPDNWNVVGMAYGAYARIIEALEAKDKECEERVGEERERMLENMLYDLDKLNSDWKSKVEWIGSELQRYRDGYFEDLQALTPTKTDK